MRRLFGGMYKHAQVDGVDRETWHDGIIIGSPCAGAYCGCGDRHHACRDYRSSRGEPLHEHPMHTTPYTPGAHHTMHMHTYTHIVLTPHITCTPSTHYTHHSIPISWFHPGPICFPWVSDPRVRPRHRLGLLGPDPAPGHQTHAEVSGAQSGCSRLTLIWP